MRQRHRGGRRPQPKSSGLRDLLMPAVVWACILTIVGAIGLDVARRARPEVSAAPQVPRETSPEPVVTRPKPEPTRPKPQRRQRRDRRQYPAPPTSITI